MNKILLVSVSKNDKHEINLSKCPDILNLIDCLYVSNNTTPITKVYNIYLNKIRETKRYEYLIFIHGDANVDLKHLISHIEECKNKYDIMGLCGCEIVNVSQSPLNWFTSSRLNPDKRWGCVTHGELGNQMSFFSRDRENISDHEVGAIDGVCIIFGPKALYSKILFDEQFLFDQYDLDISFQCILKYNMKLGVLVETSLQHYSVGKSILTQDFLQHEKDFRKKWNIELN